MTSAQSSKSKSQLMHQQKRSSKIPQLTLSKVAQMGRYENVNNVNTRSEHHSPRFESSISVKGNFFVEFILL